MAGRGRPRKIPLSESVAAKPKPAPIPTEAPRAKPTAAALKRDLTHLAEERKRISAKKRELVEGLPHLYGWKWYAWARTFFESRHKMSLLVAANQISKSSTQIRKCIDWATAVQKWPTLWKTRPTQFWYLYPSRDVSSVEFTKKWMTEFLPRGKYKDDPQYGWREEYGDKRKIYALHFNTGVSVYFKTYKQDAQDLQTGTCHAIFCDEELPENLYDELMFRLEAVDGYFSMVFTATLNQQMWWRAMEGKGLEELFPDALKMQVTMYDCMYYEDGTEGVYNEAKIARAIARCRNQNEVQRRVFGKFVSDTGRKYGEFSPDRHYVKSFPIDTDYKIYAACDIGSGGDNGHPAAIAFVAVAPDYRKGYVFRGWRGDGVLTTAGDILEKFKDLRGRTSCTLQVFDQNAKDFGTIAARTGESFVMAQKSHEVGEDVINTLFKNDMLFIFDEDELKKLGGELISLMKATPKNKAKDDFIDAMRYAVTKVPWDWTAISGGLSEDEQRAKEESRPRTAKEMLDAEIRERRGEEEFRETSDWDALEGEFAEWNAAYGN